MTRWDDFKILYKINFNNKIKIIDFRNFFELEKFKNNKIKLITIGNSSLF